MKFLDANIFLRYLVTGDERKARDCLALFQRIQAGDEVVATSEVIVAEVSYVLRSRAHYDLTPAEIAARLKPLLALRGLKLDHKGASLQALEIWDAHPLLDFEDALAVAHMERQGLTEIYSYDSDFDRVANVKRVVP